MLPVLAIALVLGTAGSEVGTSPSYATPCTNTIKGRVVYWDKTVDGLDGEMRYCGANPSLVFDWKPLAFIQSGTTPPAGDCDEAVEASRLFFDTDADTTGSLLVCLGLLGWKDIDDDGGAGGAAAVGEVDGVPLVLNVVTLQFDQADGLTVTDLGGAVARVDLGTLGDAQVNGANEADELVLAGDVDGTANANDIDQTAVRDELEGVLRADQLQGNLGVAHLNSGTGASSSTYWRGDGTWAAVGGVSTVSVTVDFSASGADSVDTVVTGQAWVTSSSVIVCAPTLFATADRTDGEDDALAEGLKVSVKARSAGVGFTLVVHTDGDAWGDPRTEGPLVAGAAGQVYAHAGAGTDKAYGRFLIHCTGV